MANSKGKFNGVQIELDGEVIAEITKFEMTDEDKKRIESNTSDSFPVSGTVTFTYWISKAREVFTKALFYVTRFRN